MTKIKDKGVICVDFDGTLSIHEYPNIGKEVPLAIETCKKLQKLGYKLILYTMRDGKELEEAIAWCKERGLEFWDHNNNPQQHTWTQSRKVYAILYIDDAAYGCPLIYPEDSRPYVDWSGVLDYIKGLR